MANPYELLNKTVIAHINLYLVQELEVSPLPPMGYRLKSQTHFHRVNHPFTKEESKKLHNMENDPEVLKVKATQISFIIFALELARMFVEEIPCEHRPHLNISDKKLVKGHRVYLTQLLELKYADKATYDEKKEIIASTREIAKEFFDYLVKNLVKKD